VITTFWEDVDLQLSFVLIAQKLLEEMITNPISVASVRWTNIGGNTLLRKKIISLTKLNKLRSRKSLKLVKLRLRRNCKQKHKTGKDGKMK